MGTELSSICRAFQSENGSKRKFVSLNAGPDALLKLLQMVVQCLVTNAEINGEYLWQGNGLPDRLKRPAHFARSL